MQCILACFQCRADLVGLVRLHDEGVARGAPLFHASHDHHKAVCGWLRADVNAGVLPSQEVLDEGCLSCKHSLSITGSWRISYRRHERPRCSSPIRHAAMSRLGTVCWLRAVALGDGYLSYHMQVVQLTQTTDEHGDACSTCGVLSQQQH